MKNNLLLTALLFTSICCHAQEVKQQLLNRYFEPTTNEAEAFFVRLSQPYQNYWAFTDYDSKNRIIRSGFFADSNQTILAGPFRFYWDGQPLYKGRYTDDGRPYGFWYFYNAKGIIVDSLHYLPQQTQPVAASKLKQDTDEAAEKAKAKQLQNEHQLKDSTPVFATVEQEAAFPGGDKGWSKYLQKQLDLPQLVMSITRPQTMSVQVQFVVCNDGTVCSVEALGSTHPLLDMMAVNAIRKGPRWNPAVQNGKNVKAWRRQRISFIIPEQ